MAPRVSMANKNPEDTTPRKKRPYPNHHRIGAWNAHTSADETPQEYQHHQKQRRTLVTKTPKKKDLRCL
ncbi:hypothetical protein L484_015583 [Morus notabilis]|uniref:Uncharacterized protein n=1 Tax=Morus notabilis TaxID=981085 RepID=W9SRX3_9ROSA|nr:hypothetical protein L484_015583 [Morus notabilis]